MRDDIFDVVGVIRDGEIETPSLVDAGLPQVPALIILLGVEVRGVGASRRETSIAFGKPAEHSAGRLSNFR